jgi:tetratricopeptide (TPR) repeat protein
MMNRPVNPYVAGAPLRGGLGFFGRRDTIQWVNRELRNPATNALVLFGQRRIGKTSLLLQLQRELPASGFLPVYFDLQDQTRRALGVVLADLADTLAERLRLAAPASKDFDDQGHFFERDFLPQVYGALGDSRRLVFLFDEFDVMDQVAEAELPDTAAAKALRPFLRRLMTADPRPAFVFVVGRSAEDLSVDFMATFKSSLVHEMWVLLPEHAEALVRQAEVNGSLKFTEAAVARILSLTSDHPYLTQLLCQRIWERAYAANPETPPVIDTQEVETATTDALEAGEQALIWLWNGLSPAEKIYAAALAEVAEEGQMIPEDRIVQVLTAHAARLRTREVELAPRDLVKRRVLEMAGEREYRFAVELFRRWVRLNKPVRDVKDELDRIEPVADRLYEIGRDYFNRRQWDNAVRFFHDALTAYPRHFRARLFLGETLMEQGKIDEAVSELQQAYELDRDEARLPLARAMVAQAEAREKAGDEESALTISEKALEVSPNEQTAQALLASIWTRRSKAALETYNFEEALHAYRKAGNLTDFPDDVLQVIGALNDEEQMKAYDLLLRSVPDHAETQQRRQAIWLRRGEAALERRDFEAALTAFQEAGDVEKIARVRALQERQSLETLVGEAEAHDKAERWTEAVAAYEQLIAQAPDEESRQEWQAALERCRVEEELANLFLTGVGALAQTDWKQAQHAFAEVIRDRPDYRKNGRLAASLLEQAVKQRSKGRFPTWAIVAIGGLIMVAAVALLPQILRNDASSVVFSYDFEGPIGSEWSDTSTQTTPKGGQRFLGQFGNETVSLKLSDLPLHSAVTISFDLYLINSWDGNGTDPNRNLINPGPDIWDLSIVGGPTLFQTTFSNVEGGWQAYPGWYPYANYPPYSGAAAVNTLGYVWDGNPSDSVYHLSFVFPHSASSLELRFSSSGLQELYDESWGLDNVEVLFATSEIVYAWEFTGDSEGWTAVNDLEPLEVRDGRLFTQSTGEDPSIERNGLAIDATTMPIIEIRMKVSAGGVLGLYFTTDSDNEYGEDKVLYKEITLNGQFNTYTLDMSQVPAWKGTITRLVVDPLKVAGATIEIDYIRLMRP